MSRASRQATLAKLTDVDPTTITITDVIGGVAVITATMIGGRTAMAMMPALKPRTSGRLRRIWMDRVEANLTGRCPRCHTVVGTTDDGIEMAHAVGCPVSHGDLLAAHLDPEGLRTVTAMSLGLL